jgi:hypothetical protein
MVSGIADIGQGQRRGGRVPPRSFVMPAAVDEKIEVQLALHDLVQARRSLRNRRIQRLATLDLQGARHRRRRLSEATALEATGSAIMFSICSNHASSSPGSSSTSSGGAGRCSGAATPRVYCAGSGAFLAATGCGTHGRSPRLSLAPVTAIPPGPSHSATAPRRQLSIRSTNGIYLRQAKPAGTWLTIASTVSQPAGRARSSVTIATVLPRAV